MTAHAIIKVMDEHAKCQDLFYYFQRHVIGKPVDEVTRDRIRFMVKANRVLKTLKAKNKV